MRLLVGAALTLLLAGTIFGATVALTPLAGDLGDARMPWETVEQGPNESGAVGLASGQPLPRDYVKTTIHVRCWADWCREQPVTFRVQQTGRNNFEWEGLYARQVQDDTDIEVALFVGKEYRFLVRHPDGRIFHLRDHRATRNASVSIRLTPAMEQ